MKEFKLIFIFLFIFMFALLARTASAQTPTDANLKVAFVGDTDYEDEFLEVLDLIIAEEADLVLHQGDFDYSEDPDGFFQVIDSKLGSNFPYFGSNGNHDEDSWPEGCGDADGCYASYFKDRMARLGITPDDSNLNDEMYSINFRGLKIVMVGQDGASTGDSTYAPYIDNQLKNDNHLWKVCSWHKNQTAMQAGGKSNEMGWKVYENCLKHGAIIATAHEHSYSRTKTLTNMTNQIVDTTQHPVVNGIPSNPDKLLVAPGKTFAFVSGLGGGSIRNQDRCLPTTYPYGCNKEWAKIYTSDQNADYGVLFITFNVGGNANKATGYFKTISGQIIDHFEITNTSSGGSTPLPTATVKPTTTPKSTPTATPTKPGDANNDGVIDGLDYVIWLINYNTNTNGGASKGDFNNSGFVDGLDYVIWLNNYTL